MDDARARETVLAAWRAYSDEPPSSMEAARAPVSTNHVYRLTFASRPSVYAKASSYGSFIHFRQDHQRIEAWRRLLRGTAYERLLAPVLSTDDGVFTFHSGDAWVVFYGEVPKRDRLPRVLPERTIVAFAREMARFHRVCDEAAARLPPTWKSVGSDVAILFDGLGSDGWLAERGITRGEASYLRDQCNLFLRNAERLGYETLRRMPVLIDWNIGNFSVESDGDALRLFSRWDYDWFRIEPCALDFYFLSRVVSEAGDRTVFSYLARTMLEPRFRLFLEAYLAVRPLPEREVAFMKEAYRFFVLNYVILSGEHFFQPELQERLLREAIDHYLPELDRLDFEPVVRGERR